MGEANVAALLAGVTKKRGSFTIGPIDLQFEQGYIYAIVGENGAGKSSLFGLLLHALKPDDGRVDMFGTTYEKDELAVKQRIGYVSDHPFWEDYELRTVGETVRFVSAWYPRWDMEAFWSLAGRMGLERSQKIRQLSTGYKQRLAFALAMAHDPDLLLLDEATNGLDFQMTSLVHDELIDFMGREGKTIVLATHILEEIRKLADYIVFLHQGRLHGVFEKDALLGDWKSFWVDRLPSEADRIPGVVSVEANGGIGPARLVSLDAGATERHLEAAGVSIAKVQSMELKDILTCLVEMKIQG